jgi:predicted Fe-Mo cluster-binding NifX family protein
MRIAIPIWDDKVSPVLDTASRLLIVEVDDREETSRFEICLDGQDLSRRCLRISGVKVDTLICGAISNLFSRMLMASGVDIIPEISGYTEEVLEAYLKENLFHPRFLMPGCKRNRSGQGNRPIHFKKSHRGWRERKGYGRGKRI